MSQVAATLPYATAQDPGQSASGAAQGERARAGVVRTASGERVTLLVIADGGRGSGGALAARRVVEQIFQTVSAAKARDLSEPLRRGMEIGDRALRGGGEGAAGAVAATALAVRRNRLFFAHIGGGAAFHVRGGRSRPITTATDGLLGQGDQLRVHTGPAEGLQLQGGDRLVLTSDGLQRRSPEDGRPFLDPAQIPEYVQGVPALEAARHLLSIALGRDAQEELSVAVLAVPGAPPAGGRKWVLPLALLGLLILAGGALLTRSLSAPRERQLADFGYAVLIEGSMTAEGNSGGPTGPVQRLEPMAAGVTLTANSPSKLALNSTHPSGDELSRASLFLGADTRVELESLDSRREEGTEAPVVSELSLHLGRLLVLREAGTREFVIRAADLQAGLLGAGQAALAIEVSAEGTQMYCLLGTCSYRTAGGELQLIQTAQLVQVGGDGSERLGFVSPEVRSGWDDLCSCLGER